MGCFGKRSYKTNGGKFSPREHFKNKNNSSANSTASDEANTEQEHSPSNDPETEDQQREPPIAALVNALSKPDEDATDAVPNSEPVESTEVQLKKIREEILETKAQLKQVHVIRRRQEKRVKLEASKLEKLHKKIFEIQQDTLLIKKEYTSSVKTTGLDALSSIEESRVRLGMKRLWPDIYKKFMHTSAAAKLAEVKDEVAHTYHILTSFQKFIGLKVHKLTKHNAKLAKLGRAEEIINPVKQLTWKQSDGHLGDNEDTSSDTNIPSNVIFPAPIVLDIEGQVKAFNEASQDSLETGQESAESGQFHLWN